MLKLPVQDKETTSSRMDIKGPKAADQLRLIWLREWEAQLKAIPEVVKDNARVSLFLAEDLKIKDLQDFQMLCIKRIERVLKESLVAEGRDWRKFSIGGNERGTYERFFRIQPKKSMTKPQFMTALRRSFGDQIVKDTAAMSKLYDSFDHRRVDEMDWRQFLYLLTMVMQPILPCDQHLRFAYALYASSGMLDLEVTTKLDLGTIKDMMCAPVLIALRGEVRNALDKAWVELVSSNGEAATSAARADSNVDGALVSYSLFNSLLRKTSFSRFMDIGRLFGKRDPRPWVYVMEDKYFHPVIVQSMLELRRIARNEDEVRKHLLRIWERMKSIVLRSWVEYGIRRNKIRRLFIIASLKYRNNMCANSFDMWRSGTIVQKCVNHIQRVVRGFVARRRKRFIKRIQQRALKIQSHTRQMRVYKRFRESNFRKKWAVVMIQRVFRGFMSRQRVQRILEAIYDTGVRKIEKQRQQFFRELRGRAVVPIQRLARRWIKRCKVYRVLEEKKKLVAVEVEMKLKEEEKRIHIMVYRAELAKWYKAQKDEFDRTTMSDNMSAEERGKIIAYRQRQAELARLEKERLKQEKLDKDEEARIEAWLQFWEVRKVQRVKERAELCRRVLHVPETPEEVALQGDLQERIKAQIKVVLRRADKQKIPIEVPEARDLATKEVIDAELELERDRCRQDQFAEATKEQEKLDNKARLELEQYKKTKKRRRGWAATTLQSAYRVFKACRAVRFKAYERYEKKFDRASKSYYYLDRVSRRTTFKKPKVLGSYDVSPEEGWMVLKDQFGDDFFYNPLEWNISFEQPVGTYLCDKCKKDFCVARVEIDDDKPAYCEACFNEFALATFSTGIDKEKLLLKPFKGHSSGGMATMFTQIRTITWVEHVISLTAYHKVLEDDDDEWDPPSCSRCGAPGTKKCLMCIEDFCGDCCYNKHRKPPWDNHRFTDIVDPRIMKKLKLKEKREYEKKEKAKKEAEVMEKRNGTSGSKKKEQKGYKLITYSKKMGGSSSSREENSTSSRKITEPVAGGGRLPVVGGAAAPPAGPPPASGSWLGTGPRAAPTAPLAPTPGPMGPIKINEGPSISSPTKVQVTDASKIGKVDDEGRPVLPPPMLSKKSQGVSSRELGSAKSSRLLLKMQSMKGSAMTTNSDDGLAVTLELPMI